MQGQGYSQGQAPPPGPFSQQQGVPGMPPYSNVPRPGGQFVQQRPGVAPQMQGAPAMPRGVMQGPGGGRPGAVPLPFGGVPGQPPQMMGSSASANAQGQMSPGNGSMAAMGAGAQRMMLERAGSQPVQGQVPGIMRSASGAPMPAGAGTGMNGAPRGAGMMSSGPLPRAYPTLGSQDNLGMPKIPSAGGGLDGNFAGGMGVGLGAFDQEKTPGFDDSEFPTLGGAGGMPQRGASFGSRYPGMTGDGFEGVYDFSKPHPEFSMEKEDFPALGGKGQGNMGGLVPPPGLKKDGFEEGGVSYPPLGRQGSSGAGGVQFNSPGRAGGAPGGGQFEGGAPPPPGKPGVASLVPPGPSGSQLKDRYGLLGLLPVIRMVNPNVSTLALGADLTMLGLNLNSPDSLYKSFTLPWNDSQPKNDLELTIPSVYSQQVSRCHPAVFAKFQQETLFYIFYSMPGEESQLFAADELVQRGWGFHKELKAWLMRVANTEPTNQNEHGERGSFWVFDPLGWERLRKDNFTLQYDQLETRPALG